MESNEMKLLWQTQNETRQKIFINNIKVDELENNIYRTRKKLAAKLIVEIIMALLIFIGAGFILYYHQSDKAAFNFGLKIMVLTALCFIPVTIIFYLAISGLNSIDYNKPINQFLKDRIKSIKDLVQKLWLTGLITCAIILITLFKDQYFISLTLYLKFIIFLFIFFIAFFSWTILKIRYNDELNLLESNLDDFDREVQNS